MRSEALQREHELLRTGTLGGVSGVQLFGRVIPLDGTSISQMLPCKVLKTTNRLDET